MSSPAILGEPTSLRQLLRDQHGIATREQLAAAGLSEAEILADLDGRRWQRLNDHVIATHNGPLNRSQAMWAVVLSAPGAVALCAETVYELFGVPGAETEVIHVLIPRGGRPLPVSGVRVKVHETRRFPSPDEVHSLKGLPITSLARATVDAAAWSREVHRAWRMAVAPVQARFLRPEQIRAELEKAGKVRHRKTLALLLADLEGGAQALSEVEFLRFCRRHGLPRPRCQTRLDSRGRKRYLDAEFRCRSGRMLRVEIDGGIHLKLAIRAKDTIKDNDAHIAGELVLRYASISIYTDDVDAIRQIRDALND
jgi:hypothetical protein